IYFDDTNIDEAAEKEWESCLKQMAPDIPWSVKNQARMHITNNVAPYTSSTNAMSKFPETATALGVKLDESDNLVMAAPCGIKDVIHLEVKPTKYFMESNARMEIYRDRVKKKNWSRIWCGLKIHTR